MKNYLFSSVSYKKWYFAFLLLNLSIGASNILLPLYVVSSAVKGNLVSVGVIMAAFEVAAIIGGIVWGIVSDALHKHKVILLIGIVGSGISFISIAAAQSFGSITFWFGAFGFFQAAANTVSILLIMDTVAHHLWEEHIGGLQQATNFGQVLGMILGGMSGLFGGYRGIFVLLGGLALIGVAFANKYIQEKFAPGFVRHVRHDLNPDHIVKWFGLAVEHLISHPLLFHHRATKEGLKTITQTVNFYTFLFAWLLINTGASIFYTPMPIFLNKVAHIDAAQVFLVFALGYGIGLFFYGIGSQLGEKMGNRRALIYAVLGRVIGAALLAAMALGFVNQWPVVIVIIVFIGFAVLWSIIGVVAPALVPELYVLPNTSTAFGVFTAVSSLGGVIGSLLGGWSADMLGFPAYFALTALVLAASIVVLMRVKKGRKAEEEQLTPLSGMPVVTPMTDIISRNPST